METTEAPAFKVVIAYETQAAAVRARKMSERLAAELGAEVDTWRMDLLVHPQLSQCAASAAVQADMIIIASRAGQPLPAHVKDWMESWLIQKRNGPTALVALFDSPEETPAEPPPVYEYLSQAAERGGMDFFCNAGQWRLPGFQDTKENNPFQPEEELQEASTRYSTWRG